MYDDVSFSFRKPTNMNKIFLTEVLSLTSGVGIHRAGSRHVLVFDRANNDHVGRYMCYATNEMGSAQKVIHIEIGDLVEGNQDQGLEVDEDYKCQDLERKMGLNEDKLEEFKRKVEVEIGALRNATLSALK